MMTGFYTAASGMLMQQRSLNVISNNMANTKTPGFKSEQVVSTTFEQELLMRRETGNSGAIGKGAPVRIVQDVPSTFDPTFLEETGRPFDVAINGEGYFNIRSADGQQYMTRNGGFDLDEEGYLSLRGVGRVMGRRGEISLKGSSDFTVEQDGSVYDVQGKRVDSLLITQPREGAQLAKFANGMYQVDPNPPAPPLQAGEVAPVEPVVADVITLTEPDIRQYVLEGSNSDMNKEMSLLMETQRTFQACSKALQAIDELNQKTVAIAGQ